MITGQILRDMIAGEGIEVLDKGHSVSKGNFNIKCPFCGASDPGHHMGIRLDNGWWGCWRSNDHRGKSPVRLLCAILNKPVWQVRQLLGLHSTPLLESFAGVRKRLEARGQETPQERRADELVIPRSFRTRWALTAAGERFYDYMVDRGFSPAILHHVTKAYGLMYATSGTFADRIVMPYHYHGGIVTWTARSIHEGARLRYRDLEKESSVIAKDDLLYNYDEAARGGKVLVALEGPFDVLKGDWAGRTIGVRCVGMSTNSLTEAQTLLLAELSQAYEVTYIALDTPNQFARMDSYRMMSRLRGVVDAQVLDASALGKDFGGASVRAAFDLLRRLV